MSGPNALDSGLNKVQQIVKSRPRKRHANSADVLVTIVWSLIALAIIWLNTRS